MLWWHALLLGVIEGVTEFLPVSSTFHLLFAGNLLGLDQTDFFKLFAVVIQGGAILAVLWLYGKEILTNKHLWWLLFCSFVPTALVGFLGQDIITNTFFESQTLMLVAFIVVGFLFIVYEFWFAKKLDKSLGIADLSTKAAVGIGLAQALAVIPGVSRAGAVILTMLLMGYNRVEAAKYSFLLALPTLGAAAAYDLFKERHVLLTEVSGIPLLLLGLVVAFVTALLVLKGFIRYLSKESFLPFGVYRIVAGFLLLLLLAR